MLKVRPDRYQKSRLQIKRETDADKKSKKPGSTDVSVGKNGGNLGVDKAKLVMTGRSVIHY